MPSVIQQGLPTAEPVSLNEMRDFLRLPANDTSPLTLAPDDVTINLLIRAARVYIEDVTGLTLASRNFVQFLDSFPFFPYFQSPYAPLFGAAFPFYFGYGPIASYPYPGIGGLTDELKSPFEIRLLRGPVTLIDHITYVGTDGNPATIYPGLNFVADLVSTPARLSPLPGQRWPVSVLGTNAVAIYYTAGYNILEDSAEVFNLTPSDITDTQTTTFSNVGDMEYIGYNTPNPPDQQLHYSFVTGIPESLRLAIKLMVSHWYFNREPVVGGGANNVPHSIEALIASNKVYDFTANNR